MIALSSSVKSTGKRSFPFSLRMVFAPRRLIEFKLSLVEKIKGRNTLQIKDDEPYFFKSK